MKVLQLCTKPPYPPVDGGTLAMNSVTQGLTAAGHEVTVLTVCSDKHPVIADDGDGIRMESVYIDLRPNVMDATVAMLCGESYHVRRYRSHDFEAKLTELLKNNDYDIVHVESIFLSDYVPVIRRHTKAPVVLRAHNVEHLIWQRAAKGCRNPLKRWYFKHLALTLKVYELEHVNHYDAVICITRNDAEYFVKNGCQKKVFDLPFGINPEGLENVPVEENSLFHIGSMDWIPNQEGVKWLVEEIWPAIHSAVPEAKLYLAGRKMPESLMNAAIDGVTVVGEVSDAMYFIGSKQINIVPLLSGSGIRVKIIEAMSAGKTVISTTIGAEGILCTDGVDILLADTPEQFATHVKRCIDDKDFCQSIGRNAYNLIAEKYNNKTLTSRLTDIYGKLIEK